MHEDSWLALAAAACDHAGIRSNSVALVGTWTNNHRNLVCQLDAKQYLKLYTREPQRQFHAECCALQVLAEHGIPAPRLLPAASPEGLSPYIVTIAVAGASAEHTWDKLSREDQSAQPISATSTQRRSAALRTAASVRRCIAQPSSKLGRRLAGSAPRAMALANSRAM